MLALLKNSIVLEIYQDVTDARSRKMVYETLEVFGIDGESASDIVLCRFGKQTDRANLLSIIKASVETLSGAKVIGCTQGMFPEIIDNVVKTVTKKVIETRFYDYIELTDGSELCRLKDSKHYFEDK